MLEAKITIEAPALADAINHLAAALESRSAVTPVAEKTSKKAKKETVDAPVDTAPAAVPGIPTNPAQVVNPIAAPVVPSATVPAAASMPPVPPAQKQITLVEISNAGADLVDRGMMPQLVELLNRYGVQTVLALDPANYTAFANDLRALGANI